MSRTLFCAVTFATGLVLAAPRLSGQGPAQLLADARDQIRARNLDSAVTLLHAVTISQRADSAERAEAYVWLGVTTFYRGTDSETSEAFRAALANRPLLTAASVLTELDSTLSALWEHEQTIALCGESLPFWLGASGGPSSTALNSKARSTRGPELISGPPLRYPEMLRRADIQGRVMVRAVIDTRGRAAPASLHIVSSAHHGFDGPVIDYAKHARFSAAVSSAGPVRSCVVFPVDFRIKH